MKTVKKIAALFALMLTTAVWADAPTPVAVWNGDLVAGDKNGITMSLRDADVTANVAAYNNGAVNLTKNTNRGSQGIILSWNSGAYTSKEMTVFVRYSGLAHDNGNTSLLSMLWGATDKEFVSSTNGGRTGVGLACNVTTTTVTNWPVDRNTAYVVPSEGIMMVSYSGVSASKGVRLAFAAKSGESYGEFTQAYYYNGDMCVVDGAFNGLKIGGTIASTGGFYRPTMTIDAVSVFAQSTTIEEAEALKDEAFTEVKSYKVGDTVVWSNTGTENATVSTTDSPITEANFNVCIPATKELPAGAVVRINKVRLASINTTFQSWTDNTSDCSLININGIRSNGANGITVNSSTPAQFLADGVEDAYIASSTTQSDHALNFTFSSNVDLTVGETYAGDSNNSNAHGLALCHHNGNLCYGSGHDWTAIRYVTSNDANSIFINPTAAANGNYPVYEITATVISLPSDSITVELNGSKTWAELQTDNKSKVIVNVTGASTLTLDGARTETIVFNGSADLKIENCQHLTWANVQDGNYTGKLTYEIGLNGAAPAGLVNKIKTASTKHKFIFTGGATVDLGSWTGTLSTHLVFRGGTHTFKHSNGNSLFGKEATNENPTVMAEESATLNFYGHDLTGWSAAINQTGIVRAASGSTIVLHRNGNGTFYYNQTLVIDPGATIEVHSDLANNDFRMTGGTSKQMIYVMDQATDATTTPAKLIISSQLALAKDLDSGIGVYVGANAKLQITGTINSMNNAQNQAVDNTFARPIKKTGAGILEVSGTHGVTYEVATGSIGGNATVQKVNLSSGTSLVVEDNKSLTVQTALTMPSTVGLICTPVHGMTVITPPSGFAGEGYTATINGDSKTYELFMEGGALKLKYKTPPAFPEDTGAFVIEVKSGTVGEISVDVSALNLNDYANDPSVSYQLVFGDKTVVGERTNNTVVFNLANGDFESEHVYRGDFVVVFPDGEVKNPTVVYQGEKTFVWIDDALVIRAKGTINDAAGETILVEDKFDSSDYIDTCDSEYTVSISASEEVDANDDAELVGDEQGGVRIAKTAEGLKLQVLTKTEEADPTWTNLAPAVVGTEYVVTVKFHYTKGGEDPETSVTYTVADGASQTSDNPTDKLKVTEVFIADGTVLPSDLTGRFQLDKAVVVDVVVEIGHDDTHEFEAADLNDAKAKAEKMVVAIAEDIAGLINNGKITAEQYRGYFRIQVTAGDNGKYNAEVTFKDDVDEALSNEIDSELHKLVVAFSGDTHAEIKAKPGLYYGLIRGDELHEMDVQEDMVLADGEKVDLHLKHPEDATKHFYRIVVSPTPITPATTTK